MGAAAIFILSIRLTNLAGPSSTGLTASGLTTAIKAYIIWNATSNGAGTCTILNANIAGVAYVAAIAVLILNAGVAAVAHIILNPAPLITQAALRVILDPTSMVTTQAPSGSAEDITSRIDQAALGVILNPAS